MKTCFLWIRNFFLTFLVILVHLFRTTEILLWDSYYIFILVHIHITRPFTMKKMYYFFSKLSFAKLLKNVYVSSFISLQLRASCEYLRILLSHFGMENNIFGDEMTHDRDSHTHMFFKIGVNFANFAGIHLRWSLFLIKLQALLVFL